MKTIAISAALLLSATAAFAQSALSTEEFVMKASASDMFEIQSSKLAVKHGDKAVKKFARQMIKDHEKTTREMKSLIASGKVQAKPATKLPGDMKGDVDGLAKLDGKKFDEQYIDEQVKAHETAVQLFKGYAQSGDNAELKAWAGKTLPALEHHYMMAQDLDKK
jgi:putative membrane protein